MKPATTYPVEIRSLVISKRREGVSWARIVELVRQQWPDTRGGFTVDEAVAAHNEAVRNSRGKSTLQAMPPAHRAGMIGRSH